MAVGLRFPLFVVCQFILFFSLLFSLIYGDSDSLEIVACIRSKL